jgi:hypothetical protein
MTALGGTATPKEMSGLLEYVAVTAGLELIGRLQAMLLAMAVRISRSNQNWGSHTEITVAQAGINGVARRSLSAWRGKPAAPPRMASRSSRSIGLRLRSHQLE